MAFEKKINIDESQINLSNTSLKDILKMCNPSEQFVLVEKYWLVDGKMLPMQQIGNKFNMSRERIRQILNKSLNKFRRLASHDKYLEEIIQKAHNIIKNNAYIMKEDDLINKLLEDKDIKLNYNELLLLLSSDYDLYYLHRNKRFEKLFFIEPLFEDLLNDIHDRIYEEVKNEPASIDMIKYKIKWEFLWKFQRNNSIKKVLENDKLYENIIKLSRKLYLFDNKVWLEHHEEVNPKTIKLKIKYVLSKEWKPLHYEDIANKIKETFNLKSVKVPTIHNELVKWKEFVNVGMGTYWLKEWWYNGDNTIEAIKNILAKAWRPMKVSEITKEVLKERLIREVTILIVLQKNPDIFERVWKWLYKLKE